MTTQEKEMYKITTLTNLHVGSGDQNYGIVDKLVQRDPLTNFPVIHSSSLKGSLKVYCKEVLGLKEEENPMLSSFGMDKNQGNDKYFSAHLFTMPVRSNIKPYFRATCPTILKEITELMSSFDYQVNAEVALSIKRLKDTCVDMEKKFIFFDEIQEKDLIEDYALKSDEFEIRNDVIDDIIKNRLKYDKGDLVIIRDDIFMEICENLPVIARNRIEEPKNLWYEEVVPRQTEFYFFYVGSTDNRNAIMNRIVVESKTKMPVQIGANASVGYGFCKIENMAAL